MPTHRWQNPARRPRDRPAAHELWVRIIAIVPPRGYSHPLGSQPRLEGRPAGKDGLGCTNPVIRPTWLGNIFRCPRSQGAASGFCLRSPAPAFGDRRAAPTRRCATAQGRAAPPSGRGRAGRLGPCPSKSGERRTEEELAAQFRRRALLESNSRMTWAFNTGVKVRRDRRPISYLFGASITHHTGSHRRGAAHTFPGVPQ